MRMTNLNFTESQNVQGWKGPLWVISSKPLPKQGHLQQAAQDRVQAGLEFLSVFKDFISWICIKGRKVYINV